jgi:dUTP pyrophosphatase
VKDGFKLKEKQMLIEYYRIRGDVEPPERANPSDAGLDLKFNPEPKGFLPHPETDCVIIPPGANALLATGYRFGIPHGYMLEIKNRSGMASKRSLVVGACVVDSGYDGEVFVNLHNIGKSTQIMEPGIKIAQAVLIPVVHFRAIETQNPDLYGWYPITISDRGDGSLGSTGD